jgi:hypothetical protein
MLAPHNPNKYQSDESDRDVHILQANCFRTAIWDNGNLQVSAQLNEFESKVCVGMEDGRFQLNRHGSGGVNNWQITRLGQLGT